MKKTIILILATAVFYGTVTAATPSIHVEPSAIIQGDPFQITIPGASLADIVDVRFDTTKIPFFLYENTPTALVGTDLTLPTGNHTVTVSFARGTPLTQTVSLGKRTIDEAPLGIPEKLGGNTAVSQKKLVTSLEKENRILASLSTNKKNLWTEPFIFPLESPTVVDPYGYSRQTGAYTIAHKGTDFKATKGTQVKAMNRGVVRLAKYSPVYGNMLVIDHGMGLMTFYMHLSKLDVKAGQLVVRGQRIGLSGETGYALGPHLHLSIRLNKTSIDPMKFMELFK